MKSFKEIPLIKKIAIAVLSVGIAVGSFALVSDASKSEVKQYPSASGSKVQVEATVSGTTQGNVHVEFGDENNTVKNGSLFRMDLSLNDSYYTNSGRTTNYEIGGPTFCLDVGYGVHSGDVYKAYASSSSDYNSDFVDGGYTYKALNTEVYHVLDVYYSLAETGYESKFPWDAAQMLVWASQLGRVSDAARQDILEQMGYSTDQAKKIVNYINNSPVSASSAKSHYVIWENVNGLAGSQRLVCYDRSKVYSGTTDVSLKVAYFSNDRYENDKTKSWAPKISINTHEEAGWTGTSNYANCSSYNIPNIQGTESMTALDPTRSIEIYGATPVKWNTSPDGSGIDVPFGGSFDAFDLGGNINIFSSSSPLLKLYLIWDFDDITFHFDPNTDEVNFDYDFYNQYRIVNGSEVQFYGSGQNYGPYYCTAAPGTGGKHSLYSYEDYSGTMSDVTISTYDLNQTMLPTSEYTAPFHTSTGQWATWSGSWNNTSTDYRINFVRYTAQNSGHRYIGALSSALTDKIKYNITTGVSADAFAAMTPHVDYYFAEKQSDGTYTLYPDISEITLYSCWDPVESDVEFRWFTNTETSDNNYKISCTTSGIPDTSGAITGDIAEDYTVNKNYYSGDLVITDGKVTVPDASWVFSSRTNKMLKWNTEPDGSGTDLAFGAQYTIEELRNMSGVDYTANVTSPQVARFYLIYEDIPVTFHYNPNATAEKRPYDDDVGYLGYGYTGEWKTYMQQYGKGYTGTATDYVTTWSDNSNGIIQTPFSSPYYNLSGGVGASTHVLGTDGYIMRPAGSPNHIITSGTDYCIEVADMVSTETYTGTQIKALTYGTDYDFIVSDGSDSYKIVKLPEEVTLYTVWTKNTTKYTVNYDLNGATHGTAPSKIGPLELDRILGYTINNAFAIDRNGQTPINWNTEADGSGYTAPFNTIYSWEGDPDSTVSDLYMQYIADEQEIPTDVTLYLQWDTSNMWTLKYDANGGTGTIADTQYAIGTNATAGNANQFTAPNAPAKVFDHWNTKADDTGTNYNVNATITSPTTSGTIVTLYAQWAANSDSYKVIYKLGDEEDTTTTAGFFGGETPSLATFADTTLTMPIKEHAPYKFLEWNTKADGTGTAYQPGDTVTIGTSDVTLYAIMEEPKQVFYTHTVADIARINEEGYPQGATATGPHYENDSVDVRDVDSLVTFRIPSNREFVEWNTKADGTGTGYQPNAVITMGTEDITLYAITRGSYHVSYVDPLATGLPTDTTVYRDNETATVKADVPARNGLTFLGWTENTNGIATSTNGYDYKAGNTITITKNVTLYACWKSEWTYDANGGHKYEIGGADLTETTDKQSEIIPQGEETTNKTLKNVLFKNAGYTLTGWNTQADGNGDDYSLNQAVNAQAMQGKTLYAVWTASTDTAFTVRHNLQNIDNNEYALFETENKSGTTGATLTAEDYKKTITGFTYDHAALSHTTIQGDGSTVVDLYYNRNTHTVRYSYTTSVSGAPTLPADKTYKFGESVTVADKPTLDGYTFLGWYKAGNPVNGTFFMPDSDVELTGTFSLVTEVSRVLEYISPVYEGPVLYVGDVPNKDDIKVTPTYKVTWSDGSITYEDGSVLNSDDWIITVPSDMKTTQVGDNPMTVQYDEGTLGQLDFVRCQAPVNIPAMAITEASREMIKIDATYPRDEEYVGTELDKDDFTVIPTYRITYNNGTTEEVTGDALTPDQFTINPGTVEHVGDNTIVVTETISGHNLTDTVVIKGVKVTTSTAGTMTVVASSRDHSPAPANITVSYIVKHIIAALNGTETEKESKTYTDTAPENDARIQIKEGTLAQKSYTGYKLSTISPANAAEGAYVADGTVVTFKYVPDESKTKTVKYTVQHVVNGEVKDTKDYTENIWVNAKEELKIKAGSLDPKTYAGYKFSSIAPLVAAGDTVNNGDVITLTYVKDATQTKVVDYTVKYSVDGKVDESRTKTYSKTVWVNDPDSIIVEAGSIDRVSITGYKFSEQTPSNVKAGDNVATGSTITLKYVKDATQTKTVTYKVKYSFDGSVDESKTAAYTKTVWVNDPDTITIQNGSVDKKVFDGYTFDSMTPSVKDGDSVASGSVITLNYKKTTKTPEKPKPIPTPDKPKPSNPTPSDPTPSEPTPSNPEPSDPEPSNPTPTDPVPVEPTKPTPTPVPEDVEPTPSEPTQPSEPYVPDEPSETADEPVEEKKEEVVPVIPKGNDAPANPDPGMPGNDNRPDVIRNAIAGLVSAAVALALVMTGALNYLWMLLLTLLFARKRQKWHGILTTDENTWLKFEGQNEDIPIAQEIIDKHDNADRIWEELKETGSYTILPVGTKVDITYHDIDGKLIVEKLEDKEVDVYERLREITGKVNVHIYNGKANLEFDLDFNLKCDDPKVVNMVDKIKANA